MIKPLELDSEHGRGVWDTIVAAAAGDVAALRRLLEQDPELARSEYSPLRFAVREGHVDRTMAHRTECAAILLEAGATISAKDDEYRSTPLAWAARNNLPDMVEFLLARDAPTNLPDDEPWATPLAWATRRGHTQIVEMLRRAASRREGGPRP